MVAVGLGQTFDEGLQHGIARCQFGRGDMGYGGRGHRLGGCLSDHRNFSIALVGLFTNLGLHAVFANTGEHFGLPIGTDTTPSA